MDIKPDEGSSSSDAAAPNVTSAEVPTSENIPTNANGDDGLIDLYAQQPQGSGNANDGNLSGESLEGAGGEGEDADRAKWVII